MEAEAREALPPTFPEGEDNFRKYRVWLTLKQARLPLSPLSLSPLALVCSCVVQWRVVRCGWGGRSRRAAGAGWATGQWVA